MRKTEQQAALLKSDRHSLFAMRHSDTHTSAVCVCARARTHTYVCVCVRARVRIPELSWAREVLVELPLLGGGGLRYALRSKSAKIQLRIRL